MPTTPPQGTEPTILREEIKNLLESNGKIPEAQKWRLLISLFDNIDNKLDNLMTMPKEIGVLKKKNVVLWAERHPKIAIALVVPVALVILLHTVEYAPMIKAAIAFLLNLT